MMLTVTTPTDRDIVITREFAAPRRLVFEALTKPELLKRWLGVQNGWFLDVCEIDLRVGGAYRYLWRKADGKAMGMGGVYLEVAPPERLVASEKFDEAWYPGDAVVTTALTEHDGRTTLTLTIRYATKEARDGVLKGPALSGLAAGYDKLEALLLS